jgi:hypothetical protein
MKIIFTVLLFLFASTAMANPRLLSDATTQQVTHCGFYINGNSLPVELPVEVSLSGRRCVMDISSFTTRTYTVYVTFILYSGVIRYESIPSNTITFAFPLIGSTTLPIPSSIRAVK